MSTRKTSFSVDEVEKGINLVRSAAKTKNLCAQTNELIKVFSEEVGYERKDPSGPVRTVVVSGEKLYYEPYENGGNWRVAYLEEILGHKLLRKFADTIQVVSDKGEGEGIRNIPESSCAGPITANKKRSFFGDNLIADCVVYLSKDDPKKNPVVVRLMED